MNEPTKVLNTEQKQLQDELVENYGIDREDVLFYGDDPVPFLMYEANSALCNSLANISAIDAEPVLSVQNDSVAVRCTLTLPDGRVRSAVGVANTDEQIDGKAASSQQIYSLASSRALRYALRGASIDLIKRHREAMTGEILEFKAKSNYDALNGQAHGLGKEALLINGGNKDAWYLQLKNRYGVNHTNELNEEQLADWVSFLKTLVPQKAKAA